MPPIRRLPSSPLGPVVARRPAHPAATRIARRGRFAPYTPSPFKPSSLRKKPQTITMRAWAALNEQAQANGWGTLDDSVWGWGAVTASHIPWGSSTWEGGFLVVLPPINLSSSLPSSAETPQQIHWQEPANPSTNLQDNADTHSPQNNNQQPTFSPSALASFLPPRACSMLHGLANALLGESIVSAPAPLLPSLGDSDPGAASAIPPNCRSTRSGAVYSPHSAVPFTLTDLDIYDLIERADKNRSTRELDQDHTALQPIPADADYDPAQDPDYDFVPFEFHDLNLDLPDLDPAPAPATLTPNLRLPLHFDKHIALISLDSARRAGPRLRPSTPPPTVAHFDLGRPIGPSAAPAASGSTIRIPYKPPHTAPPDLPFPSALPSTTAPPGSIIRIPYKPPRAVKKTPSARQARHTLYQRGLRRLKRSSPDLPKRVVLKRTQDATPIFTALNIADDLDHTTTAWIGLRSLKPPDLRAYTLPELRALGIW
ncbi:hypothetical protein C8R46DRAFT_1215746 [Mycena filopes]|nr:hypothetical protein C8R46DRAFT_1215746 [Mycena filopes]